MKPFKQLSAAFSAGVIGAVVLLIAATAYRGMPSNMDEFKQNAYRLLIWGGIWALLLVLPLYKSKWFLRGSLIGLMVILFNFIVLMPITGKGFFGINAGAETIIGNIVFNYIWGVVAGLWYHLAVNKK
jgi:multisubunit Na+/H+ antiporter MnhB subunit